MDVDNGSIIEYLIGNSSKKMKGVSTIIEKKGMMYFSGRLSPTILKV